MTTAQPQTVDAWSRSGEAFRAYLERESLSPVQASKDFSVSRQTIHNWTSGGRIDRRHLFDVFRVAQYPRSLRWELVAHLLDVEIEDLVDLLGADEEVEEFFGGAVDHQGRP